MKVVLIVFRISKGECMYYDEDDNRISQRTLARLLKNESVSVSDMIS